MVVSGLSVPPILVAALIAPVLLLPIGRRARSSLSVRVIVHVEIGLGGPLVTTPAAIFELVVTTTVAVATLVGVILRIIRIVLIIM